RNFHDGIDFHTFGVPYPDAIPVSNDFYNNDISNVHDDCIEADGSAFNMRVFRNKCVNSAGSFVSGQPLYGGPVYVIRNVFYNLKQVRGGPLKFWDAAGFVAYNNTFVDAIQAGSPRNQTVHLLNNLTLAQAAEDPAMNMPTYTNYSSSDYNGFMPGAKAPY